ncbi:hypothetical protein LFX25_12330 [Leptospira sp. FAT2]|uniref:hypothetical protein n=1 Tax=Leptospira sanjuanensis TaxID=2879643 RepID=UPI001EE8C6E5|nr:hypothetical protein [Leptospira sanjuanensis]MCG6168612.1 hypothetical protein [Leptospira sanjuanensis]MCG6194030.1 hypothetical protein [Leptospira sanjuanensis]
MKDTQFHHEIEEEILDRLEDFSNGEILIQEILKSFEDFDRALGNTVQELFPLEDAK